MQKKKEKKKGNLKYISGYILINLSSNVIQISLSLFSFVTLSCDGFKNKSILNIANPTVWVSFASFILSFYPFRINVHYSSKKVILSRITSKTRRFKSHEIYRWFQPIKARSHFFFSFFFFRFAFYQMIFSSILDFTEFPNDKI